MLSKGEVLKASGSDRRHDGTVTAKAQRGLINHFHFIPSSPPPQQSHTSRSPSARHGSPRRSPPRLRRRRLRHRSRARPRPPDPDQAEQGGRRGHGGRRRQHGVRVHGVRADGVDLEGRDGRQHHAGALHGGERGRRGHLGPAVLGRAHVGGPLLLRARQPRHLQRPRAVHGRRALPDAPLLRRHRRPPRMVLQLRRGHRHRPAPGLRPAALHRRAVARHRRRAIQARRRRRPLPRRRRRRLGVRPPASTYTACVVGGGSNKLSGAVRVGLVIRVCAPRHGDICTMYTSLMSSRCWWWR